MSQPRTVEAAAATGPLPASPNHAASHAAKRNAALGSAAMAALVTALKVLVALLTGSLGMLSEAAHSGIDLAAAGLTLASVRLADRPADELHTYGHGKVESLSAFAVTSLMLASAIWISWEAVERILHRQNLALPLSIWPFAVLLFSIAVDLTRARTLRRVAAQERSEALAADATHFSTDVWSSVAVLIGLVATKLGEHFHQPLLTLADPVAAIVVSAIILTVALRLARQTADTLLDATPALDGLTVKQTRRQLIHDLAAIDDVLSVDRLRTRRSGSGYFADLTLALPRTLTFQRAEQVTTAATRVLQRVLPGADVVVHSVPTETPAESIHDRVRAVAARANLAIHDVSVQQRSAGLHLELHLELGETLPLRQAHDIVTGLEATIRTEVPEITTVLTHIESEPATIEQPAELERDRERDRRLVQLLRDTAATFPQIVDIHDIAVNTHHDRIQVNCHCTLPDALAMGTVHGVITSLENNFKSRAPEVARVFIHPEPVTDNRR